MKTNTAMRFLLPALVLALLVPVVAQGTVIENVQFDKSYEGPGVQLALQGTGVFRYMGFIKAYVGALYYEEGLGPEAVLGDRPKRLEVEYFYALKGSDFGKVTERFMARNVDAEALRRIRPQVAYHNSLYRDARPGDRYALTYIPGRGTELSLNGDALGVIAGAEFAAALFAMWLGDEPMNADFKQQLLGAK
ncbi:MAG: chalcone isomerase family protein [Desulfobacterales bacterium]|nr:chalcone isomerase family protein [Desulfobacterales bacterium]